MADMRAACWRLHHNKSCKRHHPTHVSSSFIHLISPDAGAGQSHDGFFEFAREGRVKHVLGAAKLVDAGGVHLKDGTLLLADMVVYAGGCEFQGSPPFLAELGLGKCLLLRDGVMHAAP